MTAAAPRCALCGSPVAERGSFRACFHLLDQSPTIAWCASCLDRDPLAGFVFARRINHDQALRVIADRGPGRVVDGSPAPTPALAAP